MSDVDQASSRYWQTTTEASGIFSRLSNNSFASANMVYARYWCVRGRGKHACAGAGVSRLLTCAHAPPRRSSSDAWMGNTFMWEEQFRGAPTIYALFHDLMNTMGLTSGAKVLFGGCSAGARGAMVHLDNIVTWMDGYGIEVRGLLDSGLWVDVEPVSDTGMGGTLLNQAADVYGFANVSSVIPDDCADAYPGEEYKCACRGLR